MEKLVKVLELMCENQHLIQDVALDEERLYFFSYNNISTWSIKKEDTDDIALTVYVQNKFSAKELSEMVDRDDIHQVTYKSEEFNDTFDALLEDVYYAVKDKVFGINELLDQIISNTPEAVAV